MREYLKIRDDVDLKELEKFGFEEYETGYIRWEEIEYNEAIDISKQNKKILIYLNDEYYRCCCGHNVLHILFDLISAGLVEKVVEDE